MSLTVDQLRNASPITVDYAIGHCDDLDVLRVLAAQYRTAMIGQHHALGHFDGDCDPCQQAWEACDSDLCCDQAKGWQRQYTQALRADRIIPEKADAR